MKTALHWSTWFDGTEHVWRALSSKAREDLSFNATGCEVAYPTWEAPVDCLHTDCRIRRGELPRIAKTNGILRYEIESGWLRWMKRTPEGRATLARVIRYFRSEARRRGVYDPWELNWAAIVYPAVSEAAR